MVVGLGTKKGFADVVAVVVVVASAAALSVRQRVQHWAFELNSVDFVVAAASAAA